MIEQIYFPTHVTASFFEESAVLLDSRKNHYYTLNDTAADFYKLLSKTGLFEEALKQFTECYEGDAYLIKKDMEELVFSLAEIGLLEIKPSNS